MTIDICAGIAKKALDAHGHFVRHITKTNTFYVCLIHKIV